MATTPRNIRFDDDLYKEMMDMAGNGLSGAYHIQEACRQYLKQFDKPVVKTKTEVAPIDDSLFDMAWALYEKKGNRKTSKAKFDRLSNKVQQTVINHIGVYVHSTPDKQYRKNFETYINQECWNDEVTPNTPSTAPSSGSAKDGSLINRLNDRSWAKGIVKGL